MATTRSFLLIIPVTLCFLLVLATAEQGKAATATTLLVIHGKALCKSNSSRIISNAAVQLVVNNAAVPGGSCRTTSDGYILITVSLNSTEQLAALTSNGSSKAFIVAPPHACGAPSLPAGKVVAAEVLPIAMMTISDDHDDAGSSVQRPTTTTIAAADTLLVPAVNGSLRATANRKDDVVHLVVATVDKFACLAITWIYGVRIG